jgi:hypothetical protein
MPRANLESFGFRSVRGTLHIDRHDLAVLDAMAQELGVRRFGLFSYILRECAHLPHDRLRALAGWEALIDPLVARRLECGDGAPAPELDSLEHARSVVEGLAADRARNGDPSLLAEVTDSTPL